MIKILRFVLDLFKKENKIIETPKIIKKRIISKNGRLFFEIVMEELDKMNRDIFFHKSISASEMLRRSRDLYYETVFVGRKYQLVLIPVTEIKDPKERTTKNFMEISVKDYGEKSINMVTGYLAPAIAKEISPEELIENNVKAIVIPHEVIPDLDENNLFIVEVGDVEEKNILTSWESYGPRGDYNIWEEEGIYLVFVVSID